jgi:DNA-3-methyladenine glycosylase I
MRCPWCEVNPVMMAYHDTEWGVPLHDERALFEFIVLDGFQAGLSWATILNKRPAFRAAFDGFDPARVARYDAVKKRRLLADAGIVRNRQKIDAAVANARAFLGIQEAQGSFDRFIWSFVDGAPRQNRWRRLDQLPARSDDSDRMSKALKQAGFSFVGSTICYAFMQAAGMVNDHLVGCFRHDLVKAMAEGPAQGAGPRARTRRLRKRTS